MTPAWRLAARCSVRGLAVAGAAGLFLVGAAIQSGDGTAMSLALVVALTLVFFALHGAWRMAKGLETFADQVPAEPHVQAEPGGEAELAWPSMSLVVQGQAALLREPALEAQAGGEPLQAPVDEGRQLAEEALASLGVQASTGEAGG